MGTIPKNIIPDETEVQALNRKALELLLDSNAKMNIAVIAHNPADRIRLIEEALELAYKHKNVQSVLDAHTTALKESAWFI
ncbi:hypothetical protein AB6E53_02345 [Vibrio breoganii]|uniref:Uncharacterized protein n=1 Tax=Vibrio breoganii TaxID=553239 RepID=A0AAP8SWY4_9VIBR|nr:hypothetical protein [Vibrio breoganii]PMP10227.1 hypothetical protein BCS93_11165 [Vibrio breoganii]